MHGHNHIGSNNTDIVVAGMTRDDLFNINAGIVKTLIEGVAKHAPNVGSCPITPCRSESGKSCASVAAVVHGQFCTISHVLQGSSPNCSACLSKGWLVAATLC